MPLTRYLVDVNCRETKEVRAIRLKRLARRMSRQTDETFLDYLVRTVDSRSSPTEEEKFQPRVHEG